MKKRYLGGIIFYIVLFAMVMVLFGLFNYKPGTERILYSDLLSYINSGQITELVVEDRQATITLNIPEQKYPGDNKRVASIPSVYIFYENVGDKIDELIKDGVKVDAPPPQTLPWWVSLMPTLLTVGIFVLFWFVFMRQAQGGGGKVMSFGKSKARVSGDGVRVTFADVAGADEEKAELVEIVDFLRDSSKYIQLGARIPKGVLLVGPPGTGKTLLAKAVAGEAKVPFFSISGSDFVEMFVGVGASRVRDLFDQAKKSAPSIIFIDEIDAVGRHRGAGLGGGHDEREQTLNQLLVEMDGFGANEGVIIIAATNRPDILDPALLRPGRFDRQVVVNYPDVKGREEILKVHSRAKPLAEDVDLKVLAKSTSGFTGADLENLMNEAALAAARVGAKKITMELLEGSIIKVIAGPEKHSKVISDKEKKLVAYHEAGHAIIHKLLPNRDPVHEVSIVQRGRAGGYTLSLPKEDVNYVSKQMMLDRIVSLLGGRVAEKVALDDISTGASNDIERVTQTAREMVMRYGMSEKLGPMTFGGDSGEVFLGMTYSQNRDYSEVLAAEIDSEVRKIVDEAYKKCEEMIRENIVKLHNVANALIVCEKLDAETFDKIYEYTEVKDISEFEAEKTAEKEEKTQNEQSAETAENPEKTENTEAKESVKESENAEKTDVGAFDDNKEN